MTPLFHPRLTRIRFAIIVLGVGFIGAMLILFTHASTASVSYTGILFPTSPQASYNLATNIGPLSASLQFSAKGAGRQSGPSVNLLIKNSSGNTLASQSGTKSPLTLSATASSVGSYQFTLTGSNIPKNGLSYTLTISYPPQDTIPPAVTISAPVAGATLTGSVQVTGTASDNAGLASVSVQVDSSTPQTVTGTTNWSWALNTAAYNDGTHTITAKAIDTSGNSVTTAEKVNFQNATTAGGWTNLIPTDPASNSSLTLVGKGKQAEWKGLSAVSYYDIISGRRAVYFRDSLTGATSYVTLPLDVSDGWSNAAFAMTSANDLWVEAGDGPVYVRHYSLSGSPLPTTASLVTSKVFGDTNSRHGDITSLANGGVVVVWHQQASGQSTWAQYASYLAPGTATWQTIGPMAFMPTASSTQVVIQHPADGGIWLFSDPDAWGSIGAAHFSLGSSGMTLDWTRGDYINTNAYGDNGPDPEFPSLAVQADSTTNTLALAYEDAHRTMFNANTTGSYVTIAHIPPTSANPPSGTITFTQMPVYVERTASLGLVVQPNATWIAYRPVDTSSLTYNELYANCYCNGAWQTPAHLGTFYTTNDVIGFGISRPEFSTRLSDGKLHFFSYH